MQGNVNIVDILLSKAKPNKTETYIYSPLSIAVLYGHTQLYDLLYKNGARLDQEFVNDNYNDNNDTKIKAKIDNFMTEYMHMIQDEVSANLDPILSRNVTGLVKGFLGKHTQKDVSNVIKPLPKTQSSKK